MVLWFKFFQRIGTNGSLIMKRNLNQNQQFFEILNSYPTSIWLTPSFNSKPFSLCVHSTPINVLDIYFLQCTHGNARCIRTHPWCVHIYCIGGWFPLGTKAITHFLSSTFQTSHQHIGIVSLKMKFTTLHLKNHHHILLIPTMQIFSLK
jgi:hypothetical protein